MRRFVLFLLILLLAAAAAVTAQDPFGEMVEVTVVEVPVTVADRAGKSIRGLARENFELYDEGKKVTIDYFDVVDLRTVRSEPGRPLPAVVRRNFLILFDLANSTPLSVGRAQAAAREFVTKQMRPLDLAAVATSSSERGLTLLTSFTNDKLYLEGMIATLQHEPGFKVADPLMLTVAAPDRGETTWGPGSAAKRDSLEAKAQEHAELNDLTAQSNANELRGRVRNQIRNLGTVARALDRLRGQKQIILLSEGFDPRVITGREDLGFQATQRENDAVLSGEIWKVDSEQRFGSSSGTNEINEMAEIFRRADVRLHAIDIRGLRSDVDAREGVRRSSSEGLSLLARPTGGTVFKNTNDLGDNFDRVLESQEVIYILGFRSRGSNPQKFHSLRVKLVNVPGGEVTHRVGYFERGAATQEFERTLTTAEIMMNRIPADALKVSAVAAPFLRGDGVADVPVIVEVDGASILQSSSGSTIPLEFFVYAFDQGESIRDHTHQRAALDLTQLRDRLSASGVKFYQTLRLPPGRYSVRVVARAGTAINGFREVDLTVPRPGERFVAPPIVSDPDVARWVMVRAPQRPGVSGEYPFQVGEKVFVPAASPVFKAGARNEVAVFAFHAGEAVDAGARVGSAAESTLLARAGGSDGLEKLLLAVDAPRAGGGREDLIVTVRDKSGANEQRLKVPVIVR